MTPKESAKVIFGVLHDDWFSWTPEVVEAFNMAIFALEFKERWMHHVRNRNGYCAWVRWRKNHDFQDTKTMARGCCGSTDTSQSCIFSVP